MMQTRRPHIRTLLTLCGAILASTLLIVNVSKAENFTVMEYSEDYPPVFFRDGGKLKGVVPDLLTAIGRLTGDTFTYVRAPFMRAQFMFEMGAIQIEPSVNPMWRDNAPVQGIYSIPYGESVNVYLFPDKDSVFDVTQTSTLRGKNFGIVRGYSYVGLDKQLSNGTIKTTVCPDEDHVLLMLANKRLDVTVAYQGLIQYRMKTQPKFRDIIIGPAQSRVDIMLRFNPSKKDAVPRVNDAIRSLRASGELKRIYDTYR